MMTKEDVEAAEGRIEYLQALYHSTRMSSEALADASAGLERVITELRTQLDVVVELAEWNVMVGGIADPTPAQLDYADKVVLYRRLTDNLVMVSELVDDAKDALG